MNAEIIRGNTNVVKTKGDIDLYTARKLFDMLCIAVEESPSGFVLDLSDTNYLDSAGMQAIFAAYKRVSRSNGRLALVVTQQVTKELLDLIHIRDLPGIYVLDSIAAAEEVFLPVVL
ncbi:MAG TPA: STAS domain-containing protein [Armatimonadota bacterium]|jgi:anti-anti-sigma factor